MMAGMIGQWLAPDSGSAESGNEPPAGEAEGYSYRLETSQFPFHSIHNGTLGEENHSFTS